MNEKEDTVKGGLQARGYWHQLKHAMKKNGAQWKRLSFESASETEDKKT